jgi:hypothetical protein
VRRDEPAARNVFRPFRLSGPSPIHAPDLLHYDAVVEGSLLG